MDFFWIFKVFGTVCIMAPGQNTDGQNTDGQNTDAENA